MSGCTDCVVVRSVSRINESSTHGVFGVMPPEAKTSKMNSHQVQDYISLVVSKVDELGEHYIARQLAWGIVELRRLESNEK